MNVLRGRLDAAARYLAVAIDKSERMGALPYLARSQAALAEALRLRGGSGDGERAAELEEQAIAAARELGMDRLLREAEAVARS
jgi:hypothetical protein